MFGQSELRKDLASGRWVLIRGRAVLPQNGRTCPYCPGREAETGSEIASYRSNGDLENGSRWLVRVIPEQAPLFRVEGDIRREGIGIFDWVSGRGASELVIEHPEHGVKWDDLPTEALERVLWMYRERIQDLYRDSQIRSVLVLRGEPLPSDSINHPVSHILGAPIVFDDLRRELASARSYYSYKQRCLYCDIVRQERQDAVRVVEETPGFLVYCPYGSRYPYEAWLAPTVHRHRFEAATPGELAELARALKSLFRRLHSARPGAPVQFVLHTSPNAGMRLREDEWQSLPEDYHWHIELLPCGQPHEDVGGFAVNPVPPELAAKQLREASLPRQ